MELKPLTLTELGAEVIGEQAVVAIPAPLLIEWDQEQVRPFGPVEECGGVVPTCQLAAQRGREPLGDRGLDQERAEVGVDPAKGLVGKVVEHKPLATGECLDQAGRVRPVSQRDRRELETGDPSLSSIDEAIEEWGIERDTRRGEVRGAFVRGAAQVIGPQLDEPAMRSQAGQRQRRILAGEQDQVGEGRSALDQEADQAMDRIGGDEVVVVEGQHERVVARLEFFEEGGADDVGTRVGPRTEHTLRRGTSIRPDRSERCDQVADETGQIAIGRIE